MNSLPANIAVAKLMAKSKRQTRSSGALRRPNGTHPPGVADLKVNCLGSMLESQPRKVDPRMPTKALAGIQRVLAGLRPSFEMQYTYRSPAKRWFHMLPYSLGRGQHRWRGSRLHGYLQLKQAEQRFRLVVEAAPSGMVMVDSVARFCQVNSRAENGRVIRRKELLGRLIDLLVPESSREKHAGLRTEYFARKVASPMSGICYARRRTGTLGSRGDRRIPSKPDRTLRC